MKHKYIQKHHVSSVPEFHHFLICIITAFMCSLLTSPLDVIKTHVIINVDSQVHAKRSLFGAAKSIFNSYGIRGFFLGIQYRLMISILASSSSIFCFQEFKSKLLKI